MAAFPKDESMPMDGRTILLDNKPIPYWKSQFWPILTNTAVRETLPHTMAWNLELLPLVLTGSCCLVMCEMCVACQQYLPSTTFPCGFGANSKMPIGLNVVGPEYSDLLTIDFARLLKTECGFDFVPPPLAMGGKPKL
jgi:hypothetical protein